MNMYVHIFNLIDSYNKGLTEEDIQEMKFGLERLIEEREFLDEELNDLLRIRDILNDNKPIYYDKGKKEYNKYYLEEKTQYEKELRTIEFYIKEKRNKKEEILSKIKNTQTYLADYDFYNSRN